MEITIKDIVNFVRKALTDSSYSITVGDHRFNITDTINDKCIAFSIGESCIFIMGSKGAFLSIKHTLTEREDLMLRDLELLVRERNAEMAINLFNHFLDKELTIDDLDEED